jgi:hypothetical protein
VEVQCHANLSSLWQSKSCWDTFSSKYFNFHLSVSFHHGFTLIHSFIHHQHYRVRQKYLTIWQNSCEWNHWHGEFVLDRPSTETQSTSVAMEHWYVQLSLWRHISKTMILSLWLSGYFVGTSIFIRTTVSLVAILYCCGWETSEKQRLPQKENLQEDSLQLELLRTSKEYVRLLSEVLGNQQAEMPLH